MDRRGFLSAAAATALAYPGCSSFSAPARAQAVDEYVATLWPDLDQESLRGSVVIRLAAASRLHSLDIGELEIDRVVTTSGADVAWHRENGRLRLAPGDATELRIDYHGRPRSGLFFAAGQQIHTAFATSQWLPCLDDPAERARLTLRVALPDHWTAVGNGEPLPDWPMLDGHRRLAGWRLDRPMPSFLFGFAAGPFRAVSVQGSRVDLPVLGTPVFDEPSMLRSFESTPRMLDFYERCSGMPYPATRYTQVLLSGRAAQELADIALLGERYARRVLDDPTAAWLGAHELAHQWWGAGVTCANWNHVWLNEGIGSYLTAQCLGACFGEARFDDAMAAAEDQVASLRRRGKDRPLVHPDWSQATSDDRSVVYDKGALFTHELRRRLGDRRFAAALRDYTRRYWGGRVVSADFQAVVQSHAAEDLRPLFSQWVSGT